MLNPYTPAKATSAVDGNAGSAGTSSSDPSSENSMSSVAAQLVAFVVMSGLGYASASAINAVSCPIGFDLMGFLPERTRAFMDAADLLMFIVMNVMYSLLQLPPTVLFAIFAMALLFVKGRFVVPAFTGSMLGYAIRTANDFGASGSQWLIFTVLEMALIGFLFWYLRLRIGRRVFYPVFNAAGISMYVIVFACSAVYGIATDF